MECVTERSVEATEDSQMLIDSTETPDSITDNSFVNLSDDNETLISDTERDFVQSIENEINLNDSYGESDDDDIFLEIDGNDSLYNGCSFTSREIICDLMDIYVGQKITKETLKSFLKLLQKVLPKPNSLPHTLHLLFQYVEKEAPTSSVKKHNFCKTCRAYIKFSGDEAFCELCKKKQNPGIFYELDLSEQIQFLFEQRNLADKLEKFGPRDSDVIQDITDGSEYKRANSRSDRQPFDLTLMLNTDGLSLVKSAKSHCWPLLLTIVELPPQLREHFLLTIGLWYDNDTKPLMNTFLYPFSIQFNKCFNEGINWVHPITGQLCNSKIVVPLITADAPARADILNMLGHNGTFGCNICEIETKPSSKIKAKRRIRVYKYSYKQAKLRSSRRMIIQAKKAEKKREEAKNRKVSSQRIFHCFGIKGSTIIYEFPFLKLSTCVIPEFMHSVLLGIIKQFLKIWIQLSGKWNLKKFKEKIEDFMNNIRPPSYFRRMPRSIFQFHFFKAQEFYNWALFYSLPTLDGKLPKEYIQHWILFIIAISKLLKDKITMVDLEQADICLNLFVRDIKNLYSDRQYTYNVHQLLHLVLCVKRWGPLWATSAFPFENYNGYLGNCVHGTKNQGVELIKNLKIAQAVQVLKNSCGEMRTTCTTQYQILGAARNKPVDFINDTEQNILRLKNINIENLLLHSRAKIGEKNFSSQLYKTTKNDDSFVIIKHNHKIKYVSIRFFFKLEAELFFMFQRLTLKRNERFVHEETNSIVEHILPFEMKNDFGLINVQDIEYITHVIRVSKYLCKQPNQFKTVM